MNAQPQWRGEADAPTRRLGHYLRDFESRLRRRQWWRAAAVIAPSLLAATWLGAYVTLRTGLDGATLALVRAGLLLLGLALVLVMIGLPLRALRQRRAQVLETEAAEFDGRLRTLAEIGEQAHPFKELLAGDALAVAARYAPEQRVPREALIRPAAVAIAALLALLWLLLWGPALYRDGARAIWVGWIYSGFMPVQRIDVQPGNEVVRRGGSVTVRSTMRGFDPNTVELHARIGEGVWQQVAMARAGDGFAFEFFSVREPISYYVQAAGRRSPTYRIDVVDVPRIEQLRLTYHFPPWTQKVPLTQDGGDITAVADTQVELHARTDMPLRVAELVRDGAATAMAVDGNDARGTLIVNKDGRYYLAARIGSERVRLTDDFLIKVQPDAKPQVQVTRPGRDYGASSIEEVTVHVQASDDFAVQSLELHYSINGGSWHTVELPGQGASVDAQYVLALESLKPDDASRSLAPGDLISYYAVAHDHAQLNQTDMFFIDVQPFDRRFSQSQAEGGGGGGGGDQEQDQITQRQREILVSTWNLLRQQDEKDSQSASVRDNATLLATLQKQLAAQAKSLAQRTQSRELVASDPKIATFVDSMQHAAQAMEPAAQRLSATQLQAAIAPEQQALQFLMRAQAQFTDVQVAMQRNGGGGGSGAQSGQDLSQIYELEMDLKKNQYETGNNASPEQRERTDDQLASRLQELARRQQQLAQQAARSNAPTPQERWQQESLRREAQQLQQELDAQRSNGGGSNSGGEASSAGGTADAANAAQRLQQALNAMDQAGAAMRQSDQGAAERAARAAQQAQQALSDAGTAVTQQRLAAMQRAVGGLAARANELLAQQSSSAAALQGALRSGSARQGNLDPALQDRLADIKRNLSTGVQQLSQQIDDTARDYRDADGATAQALQEANRALAQSDVRNQLDTAAQFLAQRRGAYVAPSEDSVTQSLRELHEQLQRAASAAVVARATPSATDPVASQLARIRALRAQAEQRADQQARASGGQSGGSSAAAAGSANGSGSPPGGGGVVSGGLLGGAPGTGDVAGTPGAVASDVGGLLPLLRARGASTQDLDAISRLTRQLGALGNGRSATMAAQLRDEESLLEQLELRLEHAASPGSESAARAAVTDPASDRYREAVAEYYRQLSRQ